MTIPFVHIIILNWNNPTDTLACLDTVRQLDYDNVRVVVVDNGSADDSAARIRLEYPAIDLIALPENLGYTGGNNAGIRHSLERGAEYVWLLNDDTTVAPDSLALLVEAAARHPDAGFLGPLVRLREQPDRILSAGGVFGPDMTLRQRGLGEADAGQFRVPEPVDFLSGCALLASRRVIEAVGAFDEAFFAYGEDIDWCYRGAQAGFRSLLVPAAVVWHPDTRSRDENSPRVMYYISRNRLLFMRKHRLGARRMGRTVLRYLYWLANWSLNPKWRGIRPKRDALWFAMRDFAAANFGRSASV